MTNLNVISLFSGIGGTCLAFKNAGFNILVANEIDKECFKTYEINFKDSDQYLLKGCIKEELPNIKKYKADVLVAGFPCQSFSQAGNRLGMKDEERGGLINYVFDIIESCEVKYVLLENVKGLISSNNGKDFQYITSKLNSMGFNISYELLNSYKLGFTRQMRERVYIVATKGFKFDFKNIENEKEIIDIDFSLDIPEFEYTKEKYPIYFSDKINLDKIKTGKFYHIRRIYLRELDNCPTLTANMGTGGHNVPIIKTTSGKIRKLSPRECFNLMGFPKDFKLPEIANCHLYKQAGNSVIVPLVQKIASSLYSQIKENR